MIKNETLAEIQANLQQMDRHQLEDVLRFIRQQKRPKGTSAKEAFQIAEAINFDSQSLREMKQAIEKACNYN